jgi:hypothetical protein
LIHCERPLCPPKRLPMAAICSDGFRSNGARGMSVREVRKALGISHSEAGRLRLRAAAQGLLEPGREDEGDEVESAADEPYRLN